MKFVVHDASATLVLNVFWQAGRDISDFFGGTVSFENLTGTVPLPSRSNLNVGNAGNVIRAELGFASVGLIDFTAMNISIPVLSSPAAGARSFSAAQSGSSLAFGAILDSPMDKQIFSLEAVPEPSTGVLAIASMAMWAFSRRREA